MRTSDHQPPCEAPGSLLVASADQEFRQRILKRLEARNWTVEEALGGAEALSLVEDGSFGALLLDSWLPDLDVQELVEIVKTRHPLVRVLVLGAEAEELSQLERLSPSQNPPPDLPPIQGSTERDVEAKGMKTSLAAAPVRNPEAHEEQPLPGMLGSSLAMQHAYHLGRLVIPRDTTVLITGETGTGKELMARAIHNLGPRARQPFVIVNCAAIPEALLESELFGYCRGAFTGASQSRLGRIHSAHGGTLFLDEVGGLPLGMQGKLLRFLQEGEVQRLGSPDVFRVDVRVIAATNFDLALGMKEGRFNGALYYRLCVFPIELAPLRKRREDILPLAVYFLDSLCREAAVPRKSITRDLARTLAAYRWPGNVRELKHRIERAFILSEALPALSSEHLNLPVPDNHQ